MKSEAKRAGGEQTRDAATSRIDVRMLGEAGLEPEPLRDLSAAEIKELREGFNLSQAAFARLLGTGVGAVRQWEQGGRHPAGTALKLLNLLQAKGLGVLL
jgi:DNA-binding transcriptional regulator YiaG